MNCASCNVELKPVFADLITEQSVQYDNALAIRFHSGYAMFFDSLEFLSNPNFASLQTLIICHDCAHKLIADNPWMRLVVPDAWGHTHNDDSHANICTSSDPNNHQGKTCPIHETTNE